MANELNYFVKKQLSNADCKYIYIYTYVYIYILQAFLMYIYIIHT